jgi:hypothetical protein
MLHGLNLVIGLQRILLPRDFHVMMHHILIDTAPPRGQAFQYFLVR